MAKAEIKPKKAKTTRAKPRAKARAGAPIAHGVGRRKTSVARAWLRRGRGSITVNDLDYKKYFDTQETRLEASMPFSVVPKADMYDVQININGGGKHSQAGAMKLAIARALVQQNEDLRTLLRKHGLLTVDSRVKERKKYGQRGARRKFQFVKR